MNTKVYYTLNQGDDDENVNNTRKRRSTAGTTGTNKTTLTTSRNATAPLLAEHAQFDGKLSTALQPQPTADGVNVVDMTGRFDPETNTYQVRILLVMNYLHHLIII